VVVVSAVVGVEVAAVAKNKPIRCSKAERMPFGHNGGDRGRIAGGAFKNRRSTGGQCIRTEGDYFEGDGGQ
jgi:hypothetical protein